VFLIGGGVSATDIARELGPVAKSVYQSTRNGPFDLAASLLPENAVRVEEVASFELNDVSSTAGNSTEERSLPVTVHLKSDDGQRSITDIDYIIICTGYHITLPFLVQFHEDETIPTDASDTVLVTDGRQIHNLHKDIFYIPDATLSFIGVPFYTATFSLFEFQAVTLAAVYSGVAQLPSGSNMKEEYLAKVQKKGIGRHFHSLKDEEEFYVKELLEWVNFFRTKYGLPSVEGHTETWFGAREEQRKRVAKLFATA
jgi:MFS transporter, ACS family, pantothenate transporter